MSDSTSTITRFEWHTGMQRAIRRIGRTTLVAAAALMVSSCGSGSSPDIESSSNVDTGRARISTEQALDRRLSTLAKYGVAGNSISPIPLTAAQRAALPDLPEATLSEDSHRRLYKTYTDLVPGFARKNVSEFWIFTDGPTGRDAFVEIDKRSFRQFALGIDGMNALPISDPSGTSLAQALIHEQGHLLSLASDQIDYDPKALRLIRSGQASAIDAMIAACGERTFMLEGCARSDSYIDRFTQQFWSEEDLQAWYASIKRGQPQMTGLFNKRPGQFSSYYAATNPGEDFAESWLRYVTGAEVTAPQTIAEQKIAFFARQPALARARAEIRRNYKARY